MLNKVRSQKSGVRSENGKVKILFSIFYFLFSLTTNAQCAMCRAALAGDANVEKAQAVNDGIVFLMVVPYLLVALIGYFVYRMKKNKTK
ncbi:MULTISPECIES: hypothetical protein [Flavobacterium]|uniref:Uncharacterized protein n=1 Tax=Flavobacterium commune TaxID=1306519 RepID=A0A1D9PAC5_9FLAO|nr:MULTISPECIES: hypothetical protein [Flavobacterium]AOZ99529.1 hypothetical protein BIW12_08785 [Flavobacterium commune]